MKSRTPRLLVAALLTFAAGSSFGQSPPLPPGPNPGAKPTPDPAEQVAEQANVPVFPAQAEVVTVDVVVNDKKTNEPVTGLTQADFIVTEDGKPQTVTSFEAVQIPAAPPTDVSQLARVSTNQVPASQASRTFIVMFDDIHLAPFQANRAKAAVAEFLTNGVREGDHVMLVSSGGSAWWSSKMMAGKEQLITMLKRLEGRYIPDTSNERISDAEAMRIHVYRDAQVIDRVSRRFETYGVSPGGQSGRSQGAVTDGDPLVMSRAQEVYYQSVTRNRITLSIMDRVLKSLAGSRGRKSLILVGEGFIYDPQLTEFKDVVQSARRGNCAVYFLDTEGLGGMSVYQTAQFGPALDTQDLGAAFSENLDRAEGAESIAADSGGFSVKNTNDLSKGITRIANDSRAYYLVGYQSTNTARDGKFRKIQVKMARKNVDVRARKGYYAALEGQKAAARKPGDPDPVIQAALDSPYESEAIPLRMTHFVGDEALLGKATVGLVTEVDVRQFGFEKKDGRNLDTLEFLLVVAHRETGEFFRFDQQIEMKLQDATRQRLEQTWFAIPRDFELAPGGYQAKMVVRDKNAKRVGTLIHEFEVPDLSSFRVSTPVLSDALQAPPAEEKDQKGPPRAVHMVRRDFPTGQNTYVFFQYDVYGAQKDKTSGMPKVTAGYVVKKKADGAVVTKVDPTPIQPTSIGRLSRFTATSMKDYTPGDYEIVLNLKDELSGKTLEYSEPFKVVPAGTTSPAPGNH
jgi:VWFA-related protein